MIIILIIISKIQKRIIKVSIYIYISFFSKNIDFEKINDKIKLNERLTKEELILIHENLTSREIC